MIRVKTSVESLYNEEQTSSTGSLDVYQMVLRQNSISIYLEYTKGSETGLQLTFGVKDPDITDDIYFTIGTLASDNSVNPLTVMVGYSGTFKIPVPVSVSEQMLKISFNLIGGSSGEVRAWVKPNSFTY